MKFWSICTVAVACALLISSGSAYGETRVIKGTVTASPGGSAFVQVKVGSKTITVTRSKDTVITRGEAGKPSHSVPLREFQQGDQFVAIVEDDVTVSMKATYVPAKVPAAGPYKIRSVTFSAPVPLKPGDIITVDLAGTPKAKAAFSVKGLLSTVRMAELSPGSYHGSAVVPTGKTIRNAPLVGYLGVGDVHAAPVQASRLITVGSDEPMPKSVPPLGFVKTPERPKQPTVATQPPQQAAPAKVAHQPAAKLKSGSETQAGRIVLTSPIDGTLIHHVILVKGAADPGTAVRVAITYSNNLTGLLKLAGSVASETVSVGKDGEFRMGPIALEGPLATNGLRFTIKAWYADRADHGTAQVAVTGDRN